MSSSTVGRPMEILLVEDSLVDARFAIGALQKSQIRQRVTLIRDGAEALEFLRREGKYGRAPRPDLLLLDLLLPTVSGQQILAHIKSDPSLASMPVVVLTASTDPQEAHAVQQLGVDGYLHKPVELEPFLELIRQLRRFWHADLILPHL